MTQQQTRFFRTLSSMDGSLFTILGKPITIRQACILGLGCGIILMLVLQTENYFLIPLMLIPAIFGFARTKTMTADEYIITLLLFAMNGGLSTKRIKENKSVANTKRVPSKRLGMQHEEVVNVSGEDKIATKTLMKIPVIDKRRAIRLNVTILGYDGTTYANQFVSIYLDDVRVGAVSTDSTGKTAVSVIPKKLGTHTLRVMPRNGDDPLLDGVVEFVNE